MFHGFYNLTSSVICQNRNLDVVSNNMVNISTPGYKKDTFLTSTFRDELLTRSGNKDKKSTVIGETSLVRAARETNTNYAQGSYETTDNVLDFALTKPGFFQIQTKEGTAYTRNGSFSIDEEGYLALSGIGRVMGKNGAIFLGTDNISVDGQGNIYNETTRAYMEQLAIVDFPDYDQLEKNKNGTFQSAVVGTNTDGGIQWKTVEKSNVDTVQEMTSMMSAQRSIQSAAQILKLYDQLMGKAANDIGSI